ncbi:hypothetical protein C8Q78DRAFT_1080400 [Trametes maxima]|nr:hypothetical protein C8Q78DRAFT_1080400 [Trametes maxima]
MNAGNGGAGVRGHSELKTRYNGTAPSRDSRSNSSRQQSNRARQPESPSIPAQHVPQLASTCTTTMHQPTRNSPRVVLQGYHSGTDSSSGSEDDLDAALSCIYHGPQSQPSHIKASREESTAQSGGTYTAFENEGGFEGDGAGLEAAGDIRDLAVHKNESPDFHDDDVQFEDNIRLEDNDVQLEDNDARIKDNDVQFEDNDDNVQFEDEDEDDAQFEDNDEDDAQFEDNDEDDAQFEDDNNDVQFKDDNAWFEDDNARFEDDNTRFEDDNVCFEEDGADFEDNGTGFDNDSTRLDAHGSGLKGDGTHLRVAGIVFQDDDMQRPEDDTDSSDTTSRSYGANDSEGQVEGLSRKHRKRAKVRGEIDRRRRLPGVSAATKRPRSSQSISPQPRTVKKHKTRHEDAFRPDWRRSQKTKSSLSHRSNTVRTPRSMTWRAALDTQAQTDEGGEDLDAELRPAFTSADVRSSRKHAKMAGAVRHLLTVETVDNDDEMHVANGKPSKKRHPRRAPADVPEGDSRSSTNLPDFVKPIIFSKIVPTVLNYFGSKRDPWDTQERGKDELLDLCRDILDMTCPDEDYVLTKNDIIYKVIQQKVYDWRAEFASEAVTVINEALQLKYGGEVVPPRTAKRWVDAANIYEGGEAFWAYPDPDVNHAHGKMQSVYILRAFATHLKATAGAVQDYGYPGGALALAATAVEHCFPMFLTGVFKAGKAFSKPNVQRKTEWWYDRAVYRFVNKPDHFNSIIKLASKYLPSLRSRQPRMTAEHCSMAEAMDVFDRSSPPISDEYSKWI